MAPDASDAILTLRCPDRPGILAAVTAAAFTAGYDIRDAAQFGEAESRTFFVRMHVAPTRDDARASFERDFSATAQQLGVDWRLASWDRKLRVLIAVSRHGHCLNDLLHRWQTGLLHADIAGVVSNHPDFRALVEWHGLPFHHFPVTPDTKPQQEAQLLDLMRRESVDLLVLARYMQILSPDLCRAFEGRCINIHHSFLPGFVGANPYARAHRRGVKLVGATAHYVTSDLDEGPIIEQDVVRVTHAISAAEMANMGREVEARVLARAVRWHVEHRTILSGGKTIVFA